MPQLFTEAFFTTVKRLHIADNKLPSEDEQAMLERTLADSKAHYVNFKPFRKKPHFPRAHSVHAFPGYGPAMAVKTLGSGTFGKTKLFVNGEGRTFVVKSISLIKQPIYSAHETVQRPGTQKLYANELAAGKILGFHTGGMTGQYPDNGYSVHKFKQKYYLFSQYRGERDLFDTLDAVPYFHFHDLVKIFLDVALDVQQLHDNGWVHHDIKPDNVLYNGKKARLGDPGMAEKKDVFRFNYGAFQYLPPELTCRAEVDAFSSNYPNTAHDIYSLGMMMNKMLEDIGFFPGSSHTEGNLFDLESLICEMTSPNYSTRPPINYVIQFLKRLLPAPDLDTRKHMAIAQLEGYAPKTSSIRNMRSLVPGCFLSAHINQNSALVSELFANLRTAQGIDDARDLITRAIEKHITDTVKPNLAHYVNKRGLGRTTMCLLHAYTAFATREEILALRRVFKQTFGITHPNTYQAVTEALGMESAREKTVLERLVRLGV